MKLSAEILHFGISSGPGEYNDYGEVILHDGHGSLSCYGMAVDKMSYTSLPFGGYIEVRRRHVDSRSGLLGGSMVRVPIEIGQSALV